MDLSEGMLQAAMAQLFAVQRSGMTQLPPVNLVNPFHGKKASSGAILAHISSILGDKARREALAQRAVAACEVESKKTYATASHKPNVRQCHPTDDLMTIA